MEKNKFDSMGRKHGYWENDYNNVLQCGYYKNGEKGDIWRNYRYAVLKNIYSVNDPYWNVYYYREMDEYVSDFEYVHIHYKE